MAIITDGRATAANAAVENITKAQRVTLAPRGYNYAASGVTGTMAAALAANSTILSMRNDPGSSKRIFIERLRLQFTTLVAFTVPVTASRRLSIVRSTASSANPSGGAALLPLGKNVNDPDSECSTASGGDCRIATTTGLTMTGTTLDTANPFGTMSLVHVGAAGGFFDHTFEFHSSNNAPIIIEPGQVCALINPVLFDAAGTWQLCVDMYWHEAVLWDSALSE